MKFIITNTQSVTDISPLMREFIFETQFEYVPRERNSLPKIASEYDADGIIVWKREGPILYIGNEKFFFHPSMAKCRIAGYRKEAREDLMIKACQLKTGDSFLDCTLGMGADAIVASYFSQTGKVVGLESESVVAHLIRWGMKMYTGNMPWLNHAIKQIEIINNDNKLFLGQQPDDSYDIVYFDPMFTRPLLNSQPISPLRKIANYDKLDRNTIKEACRVARKRVVLKTLASGGEIERLGFERVIGSKHNPIAYGVINIK